MCRLADGNSTLELRLLFRNETAQSYLNGETAGQKRR
jgi:hypothetical protein